MAEKQKQLEQLLKIAEMGAVAVQDNLDEFKEEVDEFKTDVKEIKTELKDDIKETRELVKDLGGMERLKGEKGDEGDRGEIGEQGESIRGKDGRDGKNGIDGKDGVGNDGKDGKDGKDGEDGKDGSQDKPHEIRNKLEELTNEARLDAKAIKGLEKFFENLIQDVKTLKGRPVFVGGSGGRGAVRFHDLSGSLDGSKKTFSLPAFWRIISITSSSFPTTFRETIDYTVDGTLMQITFTSEIDASTTLATGQSITIIYAEA